jgi:hypothetical protein
VDKFTLLAEAFLDKPEKNESSPNKELDESYLITI